MTKQEESYAGRTIIEGNLNLGCRLRCEQGDEHLIRSFCTVPANENEPTAQTETENPSCGAAVRLVFALVRLLDSVYYR
jgi:hypothetical protein